MIPHIYAPIKDGGFNYLAQLYIDQKRELSGTILYFLFIWILILSVPWIRSRFYEFFAYMHIFLGFAFTGILWWHIEGEYMAPNYIYVAVGILLTGFPTTFERLPENVTKVTIEVPRSLRWKPGHHSFLRMPSLSFLDNHPFTIASVPAPPLEPNKLIFLIRTHSGFTKRLASRADADAATFQKPLRTSPSPSLSSTTSPGDRSPTITPLPRLRTLIDGPYGGYTAPLHRTVDSVLLVAGGTGITAALPWALNLGAHMGERGDGSRVRSVRLVWIACALSGGEAV
ncbi:putative ferric reductase protein [Neofusicoccum parvum UCRNP2]|uniref:ferric-chelate reductase (NADPH) n=2 Tax=Neofusicoccum parvum TaxID=310453 RepID=R1EIK8_BOTPV|nr:putative ferric reductase protein [Neofusicoccum parvum UCRNP2]GME48742.1 putative ferric reductase protein [Neofusicoccum parvum]